MVSFNPEVHSSGILQESYITVKTAAKATGYSVQYLLRLLREDRLAAVKVGQVWLIRLPALEDYLRTADATEDRRFGPKANV